MPAFEKYLLKDETPVSAICRLARAQDSIGLRKLLDTGLLVDITCDGKTAVKTLAEEGDEQAVNLLLSRFNANKRYAVEGYALRGDSNNVDKLLSLETLQELIAPTVTIEQQKLLCSACKGYAQAGNDTQVDRLLGIVETLHDDTFYEGVFSIFKPKIKIMSLCVYQATYGYALKNHSEKASVLRERYEELFEEELGAANFDYMLINGYAEGGHFTQLPQGWIVDGLGLVMRFAIGGHHEQVLQTNIYDAEIWELAIRGYAIRGSKDLVDQAINEAHKMDLEDTCFTLKAACRGYAESSNLHHLNDSIKSIGPYDIPSIDIPSIAISFCSEHANITDKNILFLLANINNEDLRMHILNTVIPGDGLSENMLAQRENLLLAAKEINSIMQRTGAGFTAAYNYCKATKSEKIFLLQGRGEKQDAAHIHIASQMLDSPNKGDPSDTIDILKEMNLILRYKASESLFGLFSPEKLKRLDAIKKASEDREKKYNI